MTVARAVAYQISFPMYDSTTGLLKSGLTPTATVSKDGGNYAAVSDAPVEIQTSGTYEFTLTGTEMTAGLVTVKVTATGALSVTITLTTDSIQADTDDIQTRIPAALVSGRMDSSTGAMAANVLTATAINADAITAAKVADGTIDAATFAAGAINAAAIATDAITAAKIAADAIGASELAADAVTEIQSGLATAAALATVQADTDDLQTRIPAALVSGRIDASVGAMAANVVTAAAIATDAIGAAELAADAVTEIQSGLATAASIVTLQADTDDIQTRLPAALSGGKMDSHVNDIAASAITATSIATDAITAAKIAADAIGASELAADAVTEIQSGLATSSAITTLQADTDDIQTRLPAALTGGKMESNLGSVTAGVLVAASFAAGAFDAVFTRALSAYEGSAASRSLAWAIAKLTNKVALSAGTLSIKKTDDSTDLFTQAVVQTAGTDPVTSVDTN